MKDMPEDHIDPTPYHDSHIRPVDILRDLNPIADLVEACFSTTMDEDGRAYIRQLRRSAEKASRLAWATRYVEDFVPPIKGFIWEEDGVLIGNLTLIPFRKDGHLHNLIANVAVLPEYRRRGIAEKLTHTALRYTQQNGNLPIWLQVRDDNPAAETLYRKLGFSERTRRTTWHFRSDHTQPPIPSAPEGMSIRASWWRDWREQQALLLTLNPPEINWNLQVDFNAFKPGFLSHILGTLPGDTNRSWCLYRENTLIGLIAWEAARNWADNLWVGCQADEVEPTLYYLLPQALNAIMRHRPQSLNISSSLGAELLEKIGFERHYTLIWMEYQPRT